MDQNIILRNTNLISVLLAGTLLGLREEITQAIKELTSLSNITTISVESGCELFLRFITLTSLDHPVGHGISLYSLSSIVQVMHCSYQPLQLVINVFWH